MLLKARKSVVEHHTVTDCKVFYAYIRLIDVPDFLLLEQTFTGINSAVSNKSTSYTNNSLKIKTHYTLHKYTSKAALTRFYFFSVS